MQGSRKGAALIPEAGDPQYLTFQGRVFNLDVEGSESTQWVRGQKPETLIPLEYMITAAMELFTLCTPAMLPEAWEHAATVREHYVKEGNPEGWQKIVAMIEEARPGFRVVQPAHSIEAHE